MQPDFSFKTLFSVMDVTNTVNMISSNMLNFILSTSNKEDMGKYIQCATSILQQLFTYPSIHTCKVANNSNDVVTSLLKSLLIPVDQYLNFEQAQESRQYLVETLVSISSVSQYRSHFIVPVNDNATGVQILLATAKSIKSELIKTREAALIALTNSTVQNEQSTTRTKNEKCIHLIKCSGGIQILIDLLNMPITPHIASFLYRASKLLRQCLDRSWSKDTRCHDQHVQVMNILIEVITHSLSDDLVSTSSDVANHLACETIGIVAMIDIPPLLDINYFSTLLQCLPEPQDHNGIVTASSICLPPILNHSSLQKYFTTNSSFQANLFRSMIAYIDTSVKNGDGNNTLLDLIFNEFLVEKVVHFLATTSSGHEVAVKNAASLLARLIKMNKLLLEKCRKLRGIEILMALERDGTF